MRTMIVITVKTEVIALILLMFKESSPLSRHDVCFLWWSLLANCHTPRSLDTDASTARSNPNKNSGKQKRPNPATLIPIAQPLMPVVRHQTPHL